jgi:hypothetical protein
MKGLKNHQFTIQFNELDRQKSTYKKAIILAFYRLLWYTMQWQKKYTQKWRWSSGAHKKCVAVIVDPFGGQTK